MDDYDRARECMEMLHTIKNSAEIMPEYICSGENYPFDSVIITDVKLDSFDFVMSEAMELIEHAYKAHLFNE